mmetsp:Transcript_92725/g.178913  ORF Transcript_92725/g.178913 Transcript_92725/m.178913 type:complete len:521 (+) Transcript_92725:1-1563(+)
MMNGIDLHRDGTCFARTLEGVLVHMGVRLKEVEFDRIVTLFSTTTANKVDYVKMLAYCYANWSLQRQNVVREAYDHLAKSCPGGIFHVAALQHHFNSEALTPDLVPGLFEHHSFNEFLFHWNSNVFNADGLVLWLDFADYYLDISFFFDSDVDFCQYVCQSWRVDIDDWVAKSLFHRYASEDNNDVLPEEQFVQMLAELDPMISEEEAIAFYCAIDADKSGEVSLDEFLSSKVLKVKRLFEDVKTHESRVANKEEFLVILHSLNSELTNDEALAVYQYADVDGSGKISFAAFLQNHLLKLLEFFHPFARHRNRSLGETEMRRLLLSQDPDLSEADLRQIYKAVDTDGSGSISFRELCESHVLRAILLFKRFDLDRDKHLTQWELDRLLMYMDDSLTRQQLDVIHGLLTNTNTGCVSIGGLLSPNITRIKFLFDKYDSDRSGYLDVEEFKEMLRDMLSGITDRDIDELVNAIMPSEHSAGLDFTDCISNFSEISKRHELIMLARRRQARLKARSRGLLFKG